MTTLTDDTVKSGALTPIETLRSRTLVELVMPSDVDLLVNLLIPVLGIAEASVLATRVVGGCGSLDGFLQLSPTGWPAIEGLQAADLAALGRCDAPVLAELRLAYRP